MESYLLDTHTLLWYLNADHQLSKKAFEVIENLEIKSTISHVSLWEIAIKMSIGRLNIKMPFLELEPKLLVDGFHILPISSPHIVAYSELPLHHRDPFDRLLIAQAMQENLPILGNDDAFDAYPIQRIWK
jgi:PIN domain nuclease of toxin-antitoxin system